MSGRRGRNIAYTKQNEPAFIRQFKERVGYKEEPSIEDKRDAPSLDDLDEESGSESDDYKPQVVVLRKGDLTAEEAENYAAEQLKQEEEEDADVPSGGIKFKKPTKRVVEDVDSGALVSSTSKRLKKTLQSSLRTADKDDQRSKKLDNAKLLSFDADEDEEAGDED